MGGHHHHHGQSHGEARHKEIHNITLLGAVLDGLLAIVKVIFGTLGHSQALVADGVHSFSDLFTDIFVLIAAKHANQAADAKHPYGHGRIETLAAAALAIVLFLVAVGICWNALDNLAHIEDIVSPSSYTIIFALISVAAKELIYHLTMRVAKRLKSKMLEANAWHSRSDALSSLIVIVGIAGTWVGWVYLDAIAAFIVAIIIARVAWSIGLPALKELIDTGVGQKQTAKISALVLEVDDVISLHMLRTRQVGPTTFLDAHVQVAPRISVSEGHEIGERIRRNLHRALGSEIDVTLHIDPEDDAQLFTTSELPSRSQLVSDLSNEFSDFTPDEINQSLTIHYLAGQIELIFDLDRQINSAELDLIKNKILERPYIRAVQFKIK